MSFNDNACAIPCPRFVKGVVDVHNGMVACVNCRMWFVDDDPNFDEDEEDAS